MIKVIKAKLPADSIEVDDIDTHKPIGYSFKDSNGQEIRGFVMNTTGYRYGYCQFNSRGYNPRAASLFANNKFEFEDIFEATKGLFEDNCEVFQFEDMPELLVWLANSPEFRTND